MTARFDEQLDWFTIFRTDENDGWLYDELIEGRLRQGWGAPGLGFLTQDGARVEKEVWEQKYREHWDEDPSPKRFAILSRMLDLNRGDIVVVPKMPERNQLTVARVATGYRFEQETPFNEFRHVVDLDPQSIRTFDYQADSDSYLVSGLFARANHWAAVSWTVSADHLAAVHRLLSRASSTRSKSQETLIRSAIDDVLKEAAELLRDRVGAWNGPRFEEVVRQAFRDQGYQVQDRERPDGKGGDVDILVTPPARPYGLFLPDEIAVQVKWRQGVDEYGEQAVRQIVDWADSKQSNAVKYVISSASGFTERTREAAAANGVVLVGGLQTMCFLLGFPDRYRAEWEQ